MRSRVWFVALSLYLMLVLLGCNKSASNSAGDTNDASKPAEASEPAAKHHSGEPREAREKKREPLVVPAGTEITINLAAPVGSKISKSGETFNGTVAKSVMAENKTAIPQGSNVSGTVVDAKPLGKFAGGAELQLRLDSINVNGHDVAVQAESQTFTQKGKGKRTAVLAGGGAALGGLIGGLAGGGKGAAIGAAAGGGAGVGGAALTGNKDIVLPAEAAVSFQLSQALEFK